MNLRSDSNLPTLPAWLVGLLLLFLPWASWVWTGPQRSRVQGLLEIGIPLLVNGLCVVILLSAARRIQLPTEFRRGLRWIASGYLAMGVATLYVLLHDVLLHGSEAMPGPGVADIMFMFSYPLIMVGQLSLPRSAPSGAGPWRVFIDSAVFICGAGVPLWVFALRPSLGEMRGMAGFVSLMLPLLAFVGISTANFVLLRCVPLPSRRAFHLLLGGIAASWLADLVFTLQTTGQMQLPNIPHASNIINAMSLLMVLTGAWWIHTDPCPKQPSRPAVFSPIPMFTIVVMAVWLARYLHVFRVTEGTLQNILLTVIILLFVLLLREGLAARESFRQATEVVSMALRARFEALVEHSTDLILVVDAKGELNFASPAALRFWASAWEPLHGRNLATFLHPEDLAAWEGLRSELLQHSELRTTQQWRMCNPQGEWRTFDISGSNLLENPEVQGLVLNARDITDRRNLEEQLHQAMKMEALGRLAGVIAHDFNNLLSTVLGNVELAKLNPSNLQKLKDKLGNIQSAATRGATLTTRLAAFSQRKAPGRTTLDARRILETCLPLAKELLGEQIQLVVTEDVDTGCFQGNLADLEQVVLSLLINARDAMPEGGRITLSFKNAEALDAEQILFLPPAPGPYLLLEVADTGSGMDENVLSHVFEPFFTTKGKAKGVGLGLVGVYGIVKSFNGGVGIRSAPGRGTTIRLWFPRAPQAFEEAPKPATISTIRGSETLLLVEDEEALRQALEELLQSLGYSVHVVSSATQARSFLKDYKGFLDLLITDVIMPGDSGPKLAAELVKTRTSLRVLYISGYTAGELEAHGLAHPGATVLEKPFTREQIGRRIREVLA